MFQLTRLVSQKLQEAKELDAAKVVQAKRASSTLQVPRGRLQDHPVAALPQCLLTGSVDVQRRL